MANDKGAPPVYLPAKWENADVAAVQALYAGTANPEQQKRALAWIISHAANTDDVEYRSDPHDHAFASGRRFVGLQIRKVIQINLGAFRKNSEN